MLRAPGPALPVHGEGAVLPPWTGGVRGGGTYSTAVFRFKWVLGTFGSATTLIGDGAPGGEKTETGRNRDLDGTLTKLVRP